MRGGEHQSGGRCGCRPPVALSSEAAAGSEAGCPRGARCGRETEPPWPCWESCSPAARWGKRGVPPLEGGWGATSLLGRSSHSHCCGDGLAGRGGHAAALCACRPLGVRWQAQAEALRQNRRGAPRGAAMGGAWAALRRAPPLCLRAGLAAALRGAWLVTCTPRWVLLQNGSPPSI